MKKSMKAKPKMRFTMVLQWSDEDQTFVVLFPEFADQFNMPATDGETYKKAVKRGQNALENMVGWLKEDGKPLPEPKLYTNVDADATIKEKDNR